MPRYVETKKSVEVIGRRELLPEEAGASGYCAKDPSWENGKINRWVGLHHLGTALQAGWRQRIVTIQKHNLLPATGSPSGIAACGRPRARAGIFH
jgi:hypothetical protein